MEGDAEQAGAEALVNEVSDILGLDFQYYAHLNWGSLVTIVDILGGITVTVDEDIDDYYYTGAVFQAGVPYTIDGSQALGLARARHGGKAHYRTYKTGRSHAGADRIALQRQTHRKIPFHL